MATQIMELAQKPDFNLEMFQGLMEMRKELLTDESKKAYIQAMSAFKAEGVIVEKNKDGHNSKYATLGYTLAKVNPALSKYGLSLNWETTQENNMITVKAIVTHEKGHSDSTSLTAPPENSGSKNAIQAYGSTVSYLQRYTAFSILGLASVDEDTDGVTQEFIGLSGEQAITVNELLKDRASRKEREFIELKEAYLKSKNIIDLAQIPADHFEKVCEQINGE
jgi:hypothetical protein